MNWLRLGTYCPAEEEEEEEEESVDELKNLVDVILHFFRVVSSYRTPRTTDDAPNPGPINAVLVHDVGVDQT